MSDGLNIRKVAFPILGASKVGPTKKQTPDSRKRHFERHLEDEKGNDSDDDLASDARRLQQGNGNKRGQDDSNAEKMQELLPKELGKRIDIHI
jgi:hypothetical protein